MATSEIEKLERRYAENPQGLTFAPLAEVHRKNGDVARALELLRAGLELHPNYIPASIVLGRCHWDLGDLPAAESAFAHVLRLDDENVIALKSLADINERLERYGEAQRWLHRLVTVDRSNEEAREQLSRLEAVKERVPRPAAPTPESAPADPLPHEIAAAERAEAKSAPTPAAAKVPPSPEPAPVQPAETKPSSLDFIDTSEPAEKAKEPEPPAPEPVAGLSTHEFVPPQDNSYRLHPELTHEFVTGKEPPADRIDVETTEEVELQSSGATEFRVPNAAEDFMDLAARMSANRDTLPPLISEPATEPQATSPPPPPPPAPELPPAQAKPVAVAPAAERATLSYSVHDTKGQSVASFFQALLSARPPGATPTPAAEDGSSRSPVFAQEPHPSAPPVPAGGQLKDAAVSFDDFFNSSGGEASPLSPGAGNPKNDDLDSFQSWLQNLKR